MVCRECIQDNHVEQLLNLTETSQQNNLTVEQELEQLNPYPELPHPIVYKLRTCCLEEFIPYNIFENNKISNFFNHPKFNPCFRTRKLELPSSGVAYLLRGKKYLLIETVDNPASKYQTQEKFEILGLGVKVEENLISNPSENLVAEISTAQQIFEETNQNITNAAPIKNISKRETGLYELERVDLRDLSEVPNSLTEFLFCFNLHADGDKPCQREDDEGYEYADDEFEEFEEEPETYSELYEGISEVLNNPKDSSENLVNGVEEQELFEDMFKKFKEEEASIITKEEQDLMKHKTEKILETEDREVNKTSNSNEKKKSNLKLNTRTPCECQLIRLKQKLHRDLFLYLVLKYLKFIKNFVKIERQQQQTNQRKSVNINSNVGISIETDYENCLATTKINDEFCDNLDSAIDNSSFFSSPFEIDAGVEQHALNNEKKCINLTQIDGPEYREDEGFLQNYPSILQDTALSNANLTNFYEFEIEEFNSEKFEKSDNQSFILNSEEEKSIANMVENLSEVAAQEILSELKDMYLALKYYQKLC
ncbi:hypothetical protein HDU92_007059 [Lobulomyces angularis]|nr:hypothetical protein HDU92_007059 [Lobulomyces angularis]